MTVRLVGYARATAVAEVSASGGDRTEAYAALLIEAGDRELVQAHFSMAGGITTARGITRDRSTIELEASGESYAAANAALQALIPADHVLLSRTIV